MEEWRSQAALTQAWGLPDARPRSQKESGREARIAEERAWTGPLASFWLLRGMGPVTVENCEGVTADADSAEVVRMAQEYR